MILQVIIGVCHQDCKDDPTPEFMKVIARLIGNLTNDVRDVRIVPTGGTIPIESRPRRNIGNTNAAPAIEPADQRHRAIASNEFKASFRNAQATLCSKP